MIPETLADVPAALEKASQPIPPHLIPRPENKRKIGLCGFADSKLEAPFTDETWELWGCNDLYFHTPAGSIRRTFEVHHLQNLDARRNQNHQAWLMKGKHPVYMLPSYVRPEFPSAVALPVDLIVQEFGDYITNSISWMMALAIFELTTVVAVTDEQGRTRNQRIALPGAEIGMWGIDMAAASEYGSQRPSCEYFVGLARGMGIPVYIPDTSDLCKSMGLYGLHSTKPLYVKMQVKESKIREAMGQMEQQLAQVDAQRQQLMLQAAEARGSLSMAKYVKGVWAYETDAFIGEKLEAKDRGEGMAGSEASLGIPNSDGHNLSNVSQVPK